MYPSGIPLDVSKQTGTFVTVQGKSHQMEGQIRPHFFRGVATVVSKLFNIIQPTRAYFGQKDVQQCSVVRTMVRDLHIPLEVVVADTIRESDGLAMSSRNRFLSPKERYCSWFDYRELAPILYKGLQTSVKAFNEGIKDRESILAKAKAVIAGQVPEVQLEYLSLADPFGLEEVENINPDVGAILSGAIRVGGTRIIDNVLLGMQKSKL
jgi:pantoate--beta-alanine ligase